MRVFATFSDISITYLSLSTIPAIYTTIRKDYSADRKSKHPTFILASYGAEYYRHSFSTIKANTRHLFKVIRSRILPPFISDRKSKHPTFILAFIPSRILPSFISDRKSKHPTFILASYGAENYRQSIPTVKTHTRHLY